ncbi:MAG: hypothetical protein ACPG1A_07495 [Halioglobus sp.]
MGSSGGGTQKRIAKDQEKREKERMARIESGTEEIRAMFAGNFTPEFYETHKQNFLDYYKPQLQLQIDETNRQLTGGLARAGNLRGMIPELDANGNFTGRYTNRVGGGSSVAIDRFADLEEQHNIKKGELVDRANQAVNDKRQRVQGAQDNVIMQLQATADDSGAISDAASNARSLAEREAYDPLGQVFTDVTFGLATQADLERRGNARYDTGIFPNNRSRSSGEVVG